MLFVTKYTFKGDRSPSSVKAMLATFAETGAAPGEIAHYVAVDGRGGILITESDSAIEAFANSLAYTEWMDIETTPVLTIGDAMPTITAAYG